MLAREGGLTGAGDTDQYNQCKLWNLDFHGQCTWKIAICVGGPTAGSTGPTGAKRTA